MKRSDNKILRYSLLLATAVLSLTVHAQTHGDYLMLQTGASYPNGLEATLAYEHETRYHSGWEYFASYYLKYAKDPVAGHVTSKSFWQDYNTWNVGVAYKPCVTRGRNHHGNVRIGISGGSDLHHAIGMAHVGYEHTYTLYNGWAFYFQVREDVGIRLRDTFRTGAYIGLKIPL